MSNENLEVKQSENTLIFTNKTNECKVVINTSDNMVYNLLSFECGDRGGGKGLELLYDSLKWINENKKPPPVRIELQVVPCSINANNNDCNKLMRYYENLGFQIDDNARAYGMDMMMYAIFDSLYKKIEGIIKSKSGGKTKGKC
jgi:hypothetical protein